MPTLTKSNVTTNEIKTVESVRDSLPEGELRAALDLITTDIRRGGKVVVFGDAQSVTTTEAARVLGVSRPHLYKVLDSGALEFHIVGARDRRIGVSDLLEYRERLRDAQRANALRRSRTSQHSHDSLLDSLD